MDALLSNWKEDSEISRINREAYPNGTKTTEEVVEFLVVAKQLSELTEGYFDITVEPLTQLWKLREGKLEKMPTQEEIEIARAKVNYKNLEVSTTTHIVRFLVEGMGIDTGGIGKGYALDKVLEKIRKFSVEAVSLNFGGQIQYWSKGLTKRTFRVKHPFFPNKTWKSFPVYIESQPLSISTSGNYEKAGHILDVETGSQVKNEIRSVTVACTYATYADALSTAIFAMGLDIVKRAHEEEHRLFNMPVLILYEKDGKLQNWHTRSWRGISDYDRQLQWDTD